MKNGFWEKSGLKSFAIHGSWKPDYCYRHRNHIQNYSKWGKRFLVSTQKEWKEKIIELMNDQSLRERIGKKFSDNG